MSINPGDWTVVEARSNLANRVISHQEYLRAMLERLEIAHHLGAIINVAKDEMLAAAKSLDDSPPPSNAVLRGIPVPMKDNINTRGTPTTAGTRALADHRPAEDAPVVRQLRKSGAIIGMKLNMHELSFGPTSNNAFTGPVLNPYDRTLTAGGSSGGSGVAVAIGLSPASLGADTGGSARVPAAFCGVVGFRPTRTRYNNSGIVPISPTRDTVGPMARTVEDIVLIDSVLAGEPTAASLSPMPLDDIVLGIPRGTFADDLAHDVHERYWETIGILQRAGVTFKDVDIEEAVTLTDDAGDTIARYEFPIALAKYLQENQLSVTVGEILQQIESPDVRAATNQSTWQSLVDKYDDALALRQRAASSFEDALRQQGALALIYPTAPVTPKGFDMEEISINNQIYAPFYAYTRHGNLGGVIDTPSISLHAGVNAKNVPIGVEIAAPANADQRVLQIAAAVEPLLPRVLSPSELITRAGY